MEVQAREMENQNLIELKKRVLTTHVEFIKKMLNSSREKQTTDMTARLKHMLECITLDKKK